MTEKSMSNFENLIKSLEEALPPVFARCKLTELTGHLINTRTITNRMSRGDGPPGIKIGKKVGFSRDEFINWLRTQIKN